MCKFILLHHDNAFEKKTMLFIDLNTVTSIEYNNKTKYFRIDYKFRDKDENIKMIDGWVGYDLGYDFVSFFHKKDSLLFSISLSNKPIKNEEENENIKLES